MVNQKGIALSVVISTWNRKDLVWQAIDSVIGQQYKGPLEIVVVDDGSTDGTLEELSARYAVRIPPSNRRLVIHSKSHTGITGTLGKGIELSSGDYVSLCNSDDLWEPTRAAELLAEVDKTPDTLIHTTCKIRMLGGFRDPEHGETDDLFGPSGHTPVEYPGNATLRGLLLGNGKPRRTKLAFGGGLTIFPRKFMQGRFAMPQGLWHEEVWLLFAAIVQGSIRYANHNSYVARLHGKNESLPETRAAKEPERMRCRLVFLEHAISVLRYQTDRDVALLRDVATRARVLRYQLDISSGSTCREAFRGMALSDLLAEPREILSSTLIAKAPLLHGFLRKVKLRLTG